jgi:membrane associated rhomboid family serine protease
MGTFGRTPYRFQWRREFTPAIRWLVVANSAVFVVQKLSSMALGPLAERKLMEWFGLIPYLVVHGMRLWQVVSYLFFHGSAWHLLINLFTLWMFGRDLERAWGVQRFLRFYFLCGIGAGLCVVLVNVLPEFWGAPPRMGVTIGASGAIYGILMACAMVFPDRQVWMFPLPIMISMRMFVLIWGAIEFFTTLQDASDGISHIAHLGGLAVAYLYLRRGSFFFTVRNQYSDWRQRRLRRKFEVYMREHREEPPSKPDQWVH